MLPPNGARVESQRIPAAEHLTNFGFAALCLICYQQLAAPACENVLHTLPDGSRALAAFPCHGTGPQKTAFVLKNVPMILWDICCLKPADAWLTSSVIMLLFRLAAPFLLSPRTYSQVVAPFVSYYLRLVNMTFHLLLGPNHLPSPLASRSLFKTVIVFDLAYFMSLLGIWQVNVPLELACCAWNAVSLWVLCYWYRDITPGGTNVPFQIASRLLVPAITMYLTARQGRGLKGGMVGKGKGAVIDDVLQMEGDGACGASCRDWGEVTGKKPCADVDADAPAGARWAAGSGAGAGCVAGDDVAGLLPGSHMGPPDGQCVSMQPLALLPSRPDHGDGLTAVAAAATSAATVTTSSSAVVSRPSRPPQLPPQPQQLPYRSFLRHSSVFYKIPDAEPEQLGPGYEERLRQLYAERGQRLVSVYVRRGCVELMLVLEAARDHCAAPGNEFIMQRELVVRAVMQALGHASEGPQSPGLAATADPSCDASTLASLLSQVQMQVLDVEGEHDCGDSDESAGTGIQQQHRPPDSDSPQVLSAWPRVLLLPAAGAQQQQHGAACSDGHSGAGWPVALRVVVAWGAGSGPGPSLALEGRDVQVLARACNTLLPTRIAARCATAGIASCKYDIELLALPPRAGTLLLELSCAFAGGDDDGDGGGNVVEPHAQIRRVVLPLLVSDDADVAAELVSEVADWPIDSREKLDALLCDMGSWAAAVADGIAAGDGTTDNTSQMLDLGQHLLQYAQAAGWSATSERIAEDVRTVAAGAGAGAAADADGKAQDVSVRRRSVHVNDTIYSKTDSGRENGAGASTGSLAWIRALTWVLTSMHRDSPADAASFRSLTDEWALRMSEALQIVDSVILLALLLRGSRVGQPLLSATNGVAVTSLGISALMMLAWLVLPYRAWARLAVHTGLPSYCGYLVSKMLVATSAVPAPEGVGAYAAGLGMLLHEGLIVPGACLLSPRTAALVAALKLPVNVGVMMASGAVTDPVTAALLPARTEVAALVTTVACHVYLKLRHEARRGEPAGLQVAMTAATPCGRGGGGGSSAVVHLPAGNKGSKAC